MGIIKTPMPAHPLIFDASLIESFRARAQARKKGGEDFLLEILVADLKERLAAVDRHFEHALDLHSHTNQLADQLSASGKVKKIERIETTKLFLDSLYPSQVKSREVLDLPPHSVDLIVSLASLHLTNDTPGVLAQIRKILMPDGLFLAAIPGTGTLNELRQCLIEAETELYGGISPRIAPFIDVRDGGALLQRAGFALPVVDSESLTVRYDDAFALLQDLRAMGMQNALFSRSRRPVSKRFFVRVAQLYAEKFQDDDGRIRATFNFVWLSGWAPHPNQQKPAPRGSATTSLKQFLQ